MFDHLRKIGPGAIVAAATIGAGETVLAVRAGAWGGYELLWLVLLAAITKSFLTLYMIGRYAAVSGRAVADKLVEFPGPRGWLLWVILLLELIVAPLVFVVIAVPCGRVISQLLTTFGIFFSYKWLALVFISLAVGIGMTQKYGTLEKSQMVVCLVLLLGTVVSSVLVGPNISEILRGSFRFGHFPSYPGWLPLEIQGRSPFLEMASVFGYAGSIPMNYMVYSNWVLIKGWTVDRSGTLREALRALRWDVGFNAVVVLLVTGSFMVAGAAVLGPLHRIPHGFDLLTEQAHIFARISPAMIPIYYALILTALWGTLNALPEIYVRASHGFLCQLVPRMKSGLHYHTAMKIFGGAIVTLSWLLIWSESTPIIMIDIVALFSTNIGVGLVCLAAIWLDCQLEPDRRSSRFIWWATVLSAVVINLVAVISAREVIEKYL